VPQPWSQASQNQPSMSSPPATGTGISTGALISALRLEENHENYLIKNQQSRVCVAKL
jgi:hypothetical protein